MGLEMSQLMNLVIENAVTETRDHNDLRALLIIFLVNMVDRTADFPSKDWHANSMF